MICLGGHVSERPHVLDGDEAVEVAQKYQAHKMFFSLDAITLDGYIHGVHYMLYKAMMKSSDEVYLLIDRTKIVTRLDTKLCDFSALTGVISDFPFPDETKHTYPNVKFICAEK